MQASFRGLCNLFECYYTIWKNKCQILHNINRFLKLLLDVMLNIIKVQFVQSFVQIVLYLDKAIRIKKERNGRMKKQKVLSLMLALVMVAGLFGGCGEKETADEKSEESKTATSSESKTEEKAESVPEKEYTEEELINNPELYFATYYPKYETPITLTQNKVGDEDQTRFHPGDTWKSNQWTEWSEPMLGIKWEPKWEAADNEVATQKLNLAIATDDLPDVIEAGQGTLMDLAEAGQIMPLDEFWEKYASPLAKALWEEAQQMTDGMAFAPVTFDGHMYAIPSYIDPMAGEGMWYRVDLLDEYGLEIPETIDEFEEMLAIYKAENPNGVGLGINQNLGGTHVIFGAYGAYPTIWLEDENGNLVYGSVQPEAKDALETLNRWYELGYLDPDFINEDYFKNLEDMAAGNMMALGNNWNGAWTPMPALYSNVPEAICRMGPYLTTDGHEGGSIEPNCVSTSGWAISSKCEYPEAVIYQYNLMLDSCYRNDENLRARFPFYYDMEASKPPINAEEAAEKGAVYEKHDYLQPGPGNASSYFWNRGNNAIYYGINFGQRVGELRDQLVALKEMVESGTTGDTIQEKGWWDSAIAWFGGYEDLKIAAGEAAALVSNGVLSGQAKMNKNLSTPTPTQIEKGGYLSKIESETYMKIIVGELPLDAFDDFVEEWKANGGDAWTQEVNEWYEGAK